MIMCIKLPRKISFLEEGLKIQKTLRFIIISQTKKDKNDGK